MKAWHRKMIPRVGCNAILTRFICPFGGGNSTQRISMPSSRCWPRLARRPKGSPHSPKATARHSTTRPRPVLLIVASTVCPPISYPSTSATQASLSSSLAVSICQESLRCCRISRNRYRMWPTRCPQGCNARRWNSARPSLVSPKISTRCRCTSILKAPTVIWRCQR